MYCNKFLRCACTLALLASLLTACGGGGGSTPVPTPTLPNVLNVIVDAGPTGSGYNVNRLYATVRICQPGSTTQCGTIDHVLVDTGSSGLRLLSSAISAITPALSLNRVNGGTGLPLLNCVQFVDNTFAWGPVVTADIVLSGKRAASVPIQVIGDPAFNSLTRASPSPCSGNAMTTATEVGANGILGVGLFKVDCGSSCANSLNNGSYFTCTNTNCTATTGAKATFAQQVTNPVPLFATDNNGVLIDLPRALTATSSLAGSLIFGINTQSNNQLSSIASTATVLTATPLDGYITTSMTLPNSPALSLTSSFIDSGSNGFYFYSNSPAIQPCSGTSASFYCPASLTLQATLFGATGATNKGVSFSIGNASAMFSDSTQAVLPNLAGPTGTSANGSSFDWGLPFFYGRRVFFGIEGMTPLGTSTSGPFYAF